MRSRHYLWMLVIDFMLVLAYSANGQKLIVRDNQWNVAVYPTFSPNTTSYSVRIGEDTTLNNTTYYKIYYSVDSLNSEWQFYKSYIREDLEERIYLKEDNQDEILLYDFSLEVNDTFYVKDACTLIVNEVDSITLNNGEVSRRLKIGVRDEPDWGEQYWIAGVGSDLGFITHLKFCFTDYTEHLLCYYAA